MNLIDQLAGALFPGIGTNPMMQPAAVGGPVPSAAPAAPPAGATPPPALANALGAILKQSGAVPPPKAEPAVERSAMAPMSRLQPSGGISAPQPSQGGISAQDVSSAIKAALMGAAGVNPSAPMGSAFFQGAGGAVAAKSKFDRDADASKLAAEERALKLEDRELKLDDRAWSRSKDMVSEKRATSKEARDAKTAQLNNLATVQKLMQGLDGNLTNDQMIRLNGQLMSYAHAINKDGGLSKDELDAAVKTERDRFIKDLQATNTTLAPGIPPISGAVNSAPTAPEGAIKPAPGGTVYGATPESPATGGSGADKSQPAMPRSKADFDNLPSGAYFINPSDGRVLLKK